MSTQDRYSVFRTDMIRADREIREYRGRNFFHGPAVDVGTFDEVQSMIRETTIPLQWDTLGKGFIVYPR